MNNTETKNPKAINSILANRVTRLQSKCICSKHGEFISTDIYVDGIFKGGSECPECEIEKALQKEKEAKKAKKEEEARNRQARIKETRMPLEYHRKPERSIKHGRSFC